MSLMPLSHQPYSVHVRELQEHGDNGMIRIYAENERIGRTLESGDVVRNVAGAVAVS